MTGGSPSRWKSAPGGISATPSSRAVAERSRSVPEDASVEERERVFLQMTEDLVASLNGEIEKQIAAHLAAYRLP